MDMNLLLLLDALLDTCNVGEAARLVGMSPSAASHALARLRVSLDDPILVRKGRKFVPTVRASGFASELRRHLHALDQVVGHRDVFSPASSGETFRIGAEDYFCSVVLPPLTTRVAAEAPHVHLDVSAANLSDPTPLLDGLVDLVVGVPSTVRSDLRETTLFHDGMICVMRANHPVALGGFELEDYVRYEHVVVGIGPPRPTAVDSQLKELGRRRVVRCRVPHFLAAPLIIAESDLLLTLPRRLAARLQGLGLVTREPPIPLPTFRYVQVWHERAHRDPAHAWLRDVLATTAQSLCESDAG